MRHMHKAVIASILTGVAFAVQAAPLELGCGTVSGNENEQARIDALAKGVVTRTSKNELRVVANGRTLKFIDKVGNDIDMDATRHVFCDRKEGFILIAYTDFSLFTGKLINEATGKVTQGGDSVVLSDDRRAYFASEQPDGLDALVWKIHAIDGRKSWSGYSYIPEAGDWGRMSATLSKEKWGHNGQFTAEATCVFKPAIIWQTTLTKLDGTWDWHPKRTCPTEHQTPIK